MTKFDLNLVMKGRGAGSDGVANPVSLFFYNFIADIWVIRGVVSPRLRLCPHYIEVKARNSKHG